MNFAPYVRRAAIVGVVACCALSGLSRASSGNRLESGDVVFVSLDVYELSGTAWIDGFEEFVSSSSQAERPSSTLAMMGDHRSLVEELVHDGGRLIASPNLTLGAREKLWLHGAASGVPLDLWFRVEPNVRRVTLRVIEGQTPRKMVSGPDEINLSRELQVPLGIERLRASVRPSEAVIAVPPVPVGPVNAAAPARLAVLIRVVALRSDGPEHEEFAESFSWGGDASLEGFLGEFATRYGVSVENHGGTLASLNVVDGPTWGATLRRSLEAACLTGRLSFDRSWLLIQPKPCGIRFRHSF